MQTAADAAAKSPPSDLLPEAVFRISPSSPEFDSSPGASVAASARIRCWCAFAPHAQVSARWPGSIFSVSYGTITR